MDKFFKVKTTEEVLKLIDQFDPVDTETIPIAQAGTRILAEDIISPEDLPPFARSSMDGFAVQAKDTYGATESMPAFLEVAGEVSMGRRPEVRVEKGQAAKIPTGGMLPQGADAVVMIEYCHILDETTIEVAKSVSPLENVISPGDDVRAGEVLLNKGRRLRPQDLGLCAALGLSPIRVFKRPRVAIISTGDEVVEIEKMPTPGQVRDVNRYSLTGFCIERGAVPLPLGLCKDDFGELRKTIAQGLEQSDCVWISGGSSVGTRDLTLKVFESMGDFELLAHGISISPGKPTIIGLVNGKVVVGLPGHISSALVVAEVFLTRLIYRLCGLSRPEEEGFCTIRAKMSRNVESVSGRDDYIRVKLVRRGGDLIAEPIFGKSGLISPLVEGDGLVRIHRNTEGVYGGDEVEVYLFRAVNFTGGM